MAKRALFVVTHLLGVGHLARTAALARAFAQAGHASTLVSGGMPAPLVSMNGLRFIQLLPVRSDGVNFSRLLDANGQPADEELLAARRRDLLAACDTVRPDIVVTELFPFGRRQLAGEFLALLEHVRSNARRPRVVASIRDILVAPSRPERVDETHARLRGHYDAVLVHGDPRIVPLEASWPQASAIIPPLHYTGYIDAAASRQAASVIEPFEPDQREIVVSGGGSAAGLALYKAAIDAARLLPERTWRILAGHGVPKETMHTLAAAAPQNVVLEHARPDFPALLARCAVSVSQAGYNTVIDVLRAQARAVFVPFEAGNETEQRIRAERFAAHGLATVLPESRLSGAALAAAVTMADASPRPGTSSIDITGLEKSVALLLALAEGRP